MKKFCSKEDVNNLISGLKKEIEDLKQNQLKIQSGEFQPDNNIPVSLNNPGAFEISFPKAFSEIPKVHVTFGTLDHEADLLGFIRAKIEVISISETGFKCKVSTWQERNAIHFINASLAWIAYGK